MISQTQEIVFILSKLKEKVKRFIYFISLKLL